MNWLSGNVALRLPAPLEERILEDESKVWAFSDPELANTKLTTIMQRKRSLAFLRSHPFDTFMGFSHDAPDASAQS